MGEMHEKVLVSQASRQSRSIFVKIHWCFFIRQNRHFRGLGKEGGKRQTHKRINGLGGVVRRERGEGLAVWRVWGREEGERVGGREVMLVGGGGGCMCVGEEGGGGRGGRERREG